MAVIFNPSFPYRLIHMSVAAFLATALFVGASAAWHLLRGRQPGGAQDVLHGDVDDGAGGAGAGGDRRLPRPGIPALCANCSCFFNLASWGYTTVAIPAPRSFEATSKLAAASSVEKSTTTASTTTLT